VATRTIVTSQPDVACDVCERRLLRGEQPDIFLAAGRRRIVCELCAPRAAHEGWQRESQSQSLSMPPLRPRRGRGLFEKLRQVGRPAPDVPGASETVAVPGEEAGEPQPYDFLDGYPPPDIDPAQQPAAGESSPSGLGEEGGVQEGQFAFGEPGLEGEGPAQGSDFEHAIEIFNLSEYPRRVAGVARSLGAPVVNVRSSQHLDGAISIVVAWELCWYRYEIDLNEGGAEARVIAQGTELAELAAEEQIANSVADEYGALVFVAP
jgi:hypothetical protein